METNVLINGEWVSQIVDVQAVLEHHDQRDMDLGMASEVESAPDVGILSQTIVRSPIINHILPIRMRGLEHNDVAFIGRDFVVLKELRADGFLWEVARKEDFGAQIHNASVVGSIEAYQRSVGTQLFESTKATRYDNAGGMTLGLEDIPVPQPDKILPPQFLVLQIDTGHSIFVMLRLNGVESFELAITSRHKVPEFMLHTQPAMHLCVDPTSQYIAIAGSESCLLIYAIKDRDELQNDFYSGATPQHVKHDCYITFHGVVQKMEFLYPSSNMIVLLVLVALRGKTRMFVYEWTPGSDIRTIEPLSSRGHRLSPGYQVPLLLIPLKFRSAFILVSEDRMAVFQNILEGAPNYNEFYSRIDPPTSLHHGLGAPLWVSWTRPTNRTRSHSDHRDDVFIAREDGLLKFLEIGSDDLVNDMNVGVFDGRCDTALACIDYRDPRRITGDLLITGGESCTGGSYLVKARETPILVQSIENWAPSQDVVTVPNSRTKTRLIGVTSLETSVVGGLPQPDRLFVCSGIGAKGSITELRHGFEAQIGLYFDCEMPIMQAWTLPINPITGPEVDGTLFLMAMGSSTTALHLSGDESMVSPCDQETLQLDLIHQTIGVSFYRDTVIQVTDKSVVLLNHSTRHMIGPDQLLHVQEGPNSLGLGTALHQAAIDSSLIFYTTTIDEHTYVMVIDVLCFFDGNENNHQDAKMIGQSMAQVTFLSTYRAEIDTFVLIAEYYEHKDEVVLTLTSYNTSRYHSINLSEVVNNKIQLTAIESVIVLPSNGRLIIFCGMRNGILIILIVTAEIFELITWEFRIFGAGSVAVRKDKPATKQPLVLVMCDSKVFRIRFVDEENIETHQVWLTDASDRTCRWTNTTSIVNEVGVCEADEVHKLYLTAGSQLLLTSLDISAKTVPRQIGLGGTPTRMIYSQHLDALVVAANIDGLSTMLFLDPDTGEDLSCPIDGRSGDTVKFVSGLGRPNEKIFRLMEWPYVKGSRIWNFIIAATSEGRLLIISADFEKSRTNDLGLSHQTRNIDAGRLKIQYHTRYKLKCSGPIFSITAIPGGLMLCSGSNLLCYTLEAAERKFVRVAEYELNSFARKLEYSNGVIYALTNEHSLVVLDLIHEENGEYRLSQRSTADATCAAMDHFLVTDPRGPEYGTISLISDRTRSISGVWPTRDAIADSLHLVFEAQISNSIIRFQSAKSRPVWDPVWLHYDIPKDPKMPAHSIQSEELLGLAVDGSVHRFTLLTLSAWEFLKFIEHQYKLLESSNGLGHKTERSSIGMPTSPKIMMHVDGDVLKRCLDGRKLETLLHRGSKEESQELCDRFKLLLRRLHDDLFITEHSTDSYIRQAYFDLHLYLRQML